MRILLITFAILLSLHLHAQEIKLQEDTKTEERTMGTIKGVVKNSKGKVVPYLQILLQQDDRPVNGAYTDEDGTYQISKIPAGSYALTVGGSVNCHKPYIKKDISVSSAEVIIVDIEIDCINKFDNDGGIVVDEDGTIHIKI
jgi:hypothetical protein